MYRTEFFNNGQGLCKAIINMKDRSFKVYLENCYSKQLYLAINSHIHTDEEIKIMLNSKGYKTLQKLLDLNFTLELVH